MTTLLMTVVRNAVRQGRSWLVVTMVAALWGARLAAHDMWIEPATFFPEPGQILSLRLRVGQDLLGDPLLLDQSLVNEFVLSDAAGVKPIVRRDGRDPAGVVRIAAPGLQIVGYHSNPSAIEIGAEKFNQY